MSEKPAPSFMYASMRVFDLSLGEMLWSRRTIFMGLLVGAPVAMAGILRLLYELGAPMFSVNNTALPGPVIFGFALWILYLRIAVPLLGVFYGTSLIADEVEDKTITYLFSRPIPRGAVLVGKYIAYLVCTVFVVLPSLALVWLLLVPINGSLGPAFLDLVKDLAIVALSLAAYGALFALCGATFKRPLLVGLLYALGWETLVMTIPGYLKRLSIAYYVQGLVPQAMPSNSALSLIQEIVRESPSLLQSLFWIAMIIVVSLWYADRAVTRREYILEQ